MWPWLFLVRHWPWGDLPHPHTFLPFFSDLRYPWVSDQNVVSSLVHAWFSLILRCVLVAQSCLFVWDPVDYSSPGSSVHRILQQEYWSGLPCPSPGGLPHPGIKPGSPALQADSLPTEPLGKSSENYPNFLHYSFLFFSCFMYIDAFRFSTEKLIQQIISSLITIESSNSAQLLGSQWINLLSIIIII